MNIETESISLGKALAKQFWDEMLVADTGTDAALLADLYISKCALASSRMSARNKVSFYEAYRSEVDILSGAKVGIECLESVGGETHASGQASSTQEDVSIRNERLGSEKETIGFAKNYVDKVDDFLGNASNKSDKVNFKFSRKNGRISSDRESANLWGNVIVIFSLLAVVIFYIFRR